MNRRNIDKKHYSLNVTISLFVLIMASLVASSIVFRNNNKNNIQKKLQEVGYGQVEKINPLVLEKSNNVVDKTTSNLELIGEIKRVYNLDVIYGEGTEYLASSSDATPIYNQEDINTMLVELIECLEKYPSNIFKEIQLKDYGVEICLVNAFKNENIALATRDSNNNFKIYLSNATENSKIPKSVHHEMYHILEYYMKLEFDINEIYKDWNKYNPEGFSYQDNIALLDTSYVLNMDENREAYFVSIYSKHSDKEDRAEVFADTMISDNMPVYYADINSPIRSKMVLITNAINNSFYSVNYGTSIYWTRYF